MTPRRDTNSANRSSGVASTYDESRSRPPAAIFDLLTRLAGSKRQALVVDLGSGTGPSTTLWSDRAETVVGIEPNTEMRRRARAAVVQVARVSNGEFRETCLRVLGAATPQWYWDCRVQIGIKVWRETLIWLPSCYTFDQTSIFWYNARQ